MGFADKLEKLGAPHRADNSKLTSEAGIKVLEDLLLKNLPDNSTIVPLPRPNPNDLKSNLEQKYKEFKEISDANLLKGLLPS